VHQHQFGAEQVAERLGVLDHRSTAVGATHTAHHSPRTVGLESHVREAAYGVSAAEWVPGSVA
jgi:hypothetical protein